jgi:hypothetical protein
MKTRTVDSSSAKLIRSRRNKNSPKTFQRKLLVAMVLLMFLAVISSLYLFWHYKPSSLSFCTTFRNTSCPNRDNPVLEIHRAPCFGWCQIDKFVVYRNGSAYYIGEARVQRMGSYIGETDQRNLKELFDLFHATNYSNFSDRYGHTGVEIDMNYVIVFRECNSSKAINDLGRGPPELRRLENELLATAEMITWMPTNTSIIDKFSQQ